MPINGFLYPGASGPPSAYNVANSLRFDDGSSDRLRRTPSSAGNRRTFTFSTWVKRSALGSSNRSLICANVDDANKSMLRFTDSDELRFVRFTTGSATNQLITSAKFRDVSAWYHIVIAVDTTNSTAGDRLRLYVNGSEITSFSTETQPSLNFDYDINNTEEHNIGYGTDNSNHLFDGYMAETVLIDGQQLDPTSFGEFDEDSPTIWKPKDVSGLTFGTNGFHLDFENSGSLGADVSGNSNNFTVNNLTSVDQTTDTCTNNFCTMNSLDNYYASNTYSEGNIKFVTKASGGFAYGTSTVGLSSGKWYAEFDCIATTDSGAYHQVGIVEKPSASTTTSATANIGSTAYSWGYFALDGKYRNNESYSTYGDSWTTGDIIGVYLNLDDNELRFSKNGVIQNSGTAISITAPSSNGTGHYFITAGGMSTNASVTFEANFGNPFQSQSSSVSDANGYGAFEYSPTLSGVNYYSINTKNLAEFG